MLTMQAENQTFCLSDMELRDLLDEQIEILAKSFHKNRIFMLMGITFAEYLESPEQYDRISAHLSAGGGCRRVNKKLVMNWSVTSPSNIGVCAWCERSFTLNTDGLCHECARSLVMMRTYGRGQCHAH